MAVPVPDFLPEVKKHIAGMAQNAQKIHVVHWLITSEKCTHADAKMFVMHLAENPNHCNRCKNEFMQDEYCNCPKCGAFHICW